MKKRYYYTDPLAAAWMVGTFDMVVVSEETDHLESFIHNDFEQVLDTHMQSCYRGKYYVDPASLYLLKPRVGDLVLQCDDQFARFLENENMVHFVGDRMFAGHKIIQRGGKPFHWPEYEE